MSSLPNENAASTLKPLAPRQLNVAQRVFYGVRSLLFYIGYVLLTLVIGSTAVLVQVFGYRACVAYINAWNFLVIWWLRITCGVKFRVEGREHIPQQRPYVVLAKHQSEWETFFLQLPFAPVCTTLKKELVEMPVFGWGLATIKPIAIDRSQPREALKQVVEQGLARLRDGICVLIFPEGTRTDCGKRGRYARSGTDLAVKAGVPVLPVAHNAGECWPGKRFLKFPGVITVVIGEPISTDGTDSKQLMNRVQQWIETEVERVSQFRYANEPDTTPPSNAE